MKFKLAAALVTGTGLGFVLGVGWVVEKVSATQRPKPHPEEDEPTLILAGVAAVA